MPICRSVLVLILMGCSLAAQSADFESCAPGPVTGGCLPEIWLSAGGTLTAEPDGSAIPGPMNGFPTSGNQWLILSSATAAGFLNSPQGGPAPYPLAPGIDGDLIFNSVTLGATISFDWNYVTPECAADAVYNDFFTVDIVDPTTGLPVIDPQTGAPVNILYQDTYSTNYDLNTALTPNETGFVSLGFCVPPGALEVLPPATAKTMVFNVPASLVGGVFNVEFHVGNCGDAGFSSYAWLDNIQIGSPAAPFVVTLSSPAGPGSLQVDNAGLTPGVATYNIFTLNEPCPGGPGTGPLLGLCATNLQFLIDQFNSNVAPFVFVPTGPTQSYGPVSGLPSGSVLEVVSFEFPGLTHLSPVFFHIVP